MGSTPNWTAYPSYYKEDHRPVVQLNCLYSVLRILLLALHPKSLPYHECCVSVAAADILAMSRRWKDPPSNILGKYLVPIPLIPTVLHVLPLMLNDSRLRHRTSNTQHNTAIWCLMALLLPIFCSMRYSYSRSNTCLRPTA